MCSTSNNVLSNWPITFLLLFSRTKPGLAFLLIFVTLTLISRALNEEQHVYSTTNQGLRLQAGKQLLNSVLTPEVRHVAFLKVHKTGSSTLQNIFFRFGYKRNLTIVLPTTGNKFLPEIPLLDPLKGKDYDILAIHSKFNNSVFRSVLPNDSVFIGIIRDPLEVMISSAYYNRDVWNVQYLQNVPSDNFIPNLIRFPEKYDQEEYSMTKNSMADVFGFPKGLHVTDEKRIKSYLQYLGSIFRLVVVTEHFNESLVLMKRYLNWKLEHILYIPLNENTHKTVKQLNISNVDKGKFKERNYLDYAIYDFFYKRFLEQLSVEKGIMEEVAHFSSIQRNVQLYCLQNDTQGQGLRIRGSQWNDPFLVTKSECDLMRMTELSLIEKLRQEHISALMEEIS